MSPFHTHMHTYSIIVHTFSTVITSYSLPASVYCLVLRWYCTVALSQLFFWFFLLQTAACDNLDEKWVQNLRQCEKWQKKPL